MAAGAPTTLETCSEACSDGVPLSALELDIRPPTTWASTTTRHATKAAQSRGEPANLGSLGVPTVNLGSLRCFPTVDLGSLRFPPPGATQVATRRAASVEAMMTTAQIEARPRMARVAAPRRTAPVATRPRTRRFESFGYSVADNCCRS